MRDQPDPLSNLELRLRRVFIIGLAASASALVLGLVLYFIAPGARQGSWLLSAGLIVLMATPLLRVIVSIAEYLRARDWVFVGLTLAVLAELMVTMIYALQQR
jgi:uncharacterized membrane protein